MILLYFILTIRCVKVIYVCTEKEVQRLEPDLITPYVCLPFASLLLLVQYLVAKGFSLVYSKCLYNEKVQKCLKRFNIV
jgi:hypothetical protein